MLLRTLINILSIVIAALVPTSQWAKVRSSGVKTAGSLHYNYFKL